MDYEQLFLDNLDLCDRVVRGIAHRHRLSADEAEELRDATRLKLVENDYAVLRQFQGRCSLRTYLTTVVHRHFLDCRNARWGKWRPSIEAKRHGAVAVLLERLMTRDGLSFDQAVEHLRTNHQITQSIEDLYRLSLRFPPRTPRRFVSEDEIAPVPSPNRPDTDFEQAQVGARSNAMVKALASALGGLPAQDQIILRMRFQDGAQVSQIARLLNLEPKPLYRRIDHVMKVLRKALEEHGISRADLDGFEGIQ